MKASKRSRTIGLLPDRWRSNKHPIKSRACRPQHLKALPHHQKPVGGGDHTVRPSPPAMPCSLTKGEPPVLVSRGIDERPGGQQRGALGALFDCLRPGCSAAAKFHTYLDTCDCLIHQTVSFIHSTLHNILHILDRNQCLPFLTTFSLCLYSPSHFSRLLRTNLTNTQPWIASRRSVSQRCPELPPIFTPPRNHCANHQHMWCKLDLCLRDHHNSP